MKVVVWKRQRIDVWVYGDGNHRLEGGMVVDIMFKVGHERGFWVSFIFMNNNKNKKNYYYYYNYYMKSSFVKEYEMI